MISKKALKIGKEPKFEECLARGSGMSKKMVIGGAIRMSSE